VENVFEEFFEGLGKGTFGQQAYGQPFGIEEEEQELIEAAKDWNQQTLDILDMCFPIENLPSENSRLTCEEMLVEIKQFCDDRKEQITKDNTPVCEDSRIAEYFVQNVQVVSNDTTTKAGDHLTAAPPATSDQFLTEHMAGAKKGQEDRDACEAAGIDTEERAKEPVECPTNYNATQCEVYQNGYNVVFKLDKAFSEFEERLGEGLLGQQ
jgi:hypothetical protein